MTVTFDRETGRYQWATIVATGESPTYHEARYLSLYPELHKACMAVLARYGLLPMHDVFADQACESVLAKLNREPALAKNTDSWLRYRAILYVRSRISQHARTQQLGWGREVPLLTADSPVDEWANARRYMRQPRKAYDELCTSGPESDGRFIIQDILGMLAQPSHQAIVAMLYSGDSYEDIGRALHISGNAVRSQLMTIRKRLTDCGARELLLA